MEKPGNYPMKSKDNSNFYFAALKSENQEEYFK